MLNETLGDGWIEADGDTLRLSQTAEIWVDVISFKTLIAQNGIEQLEQAVALNRGEFLTGFTLSDSPTFDDWQFFEAETLRQTLISALDELIQPAMQAAAYEIAIPHARRRLASTIPRK